MSRVFEKLELTENNSIPIMIGKLEPSLLENLKNKVHEIKNNQPVNFNWALAGHMQETLLFPATKSPELTDFMYDMYRAYSEMFNTSKDATLSSYWVNFQKKHEFNPIHKHNGLATFAIWIDVPFDIEDEKKVFTSSAFNVTANFQMIYTSNVKNKDIAVHNLPVDKSWEGSVIMFPTGLLHCVYPFYTSDAYRISISGNIYEACTLMTIV